jgi:hypothetical protein
MQVDKKINFTLLSVAGTYVTYIFFLCHYKKNGLILNCYQIIQQERLNFYPHILKQKRLYFCISQETEEKKEM